MTNDHDYTQLTKEQLIGWLHCRDEKIGELQAKIDQLMLEFCPEEMTEQQIKEWGDNQRPVSEQEEKEINRLIGI